VRRCTKRIPLAKIPRERETRPRRADSL